MDPRCPLCRTDGGEVLWRAAACRVVLVDEPGLPGYCRVVWNRHVAELTSLSVGEQRSLLRVVDAVERALRRTLVPHKVNVASHGNLVPHLTVHVVPRWRDDPYFPGAVWAAPRRAPAAPAGASARLAALRAELGARLIAAAGGTAFAAVE